MSKVSCPVACPKCGVGGGERCRSLTTNRVTDMHMARFHAWTKARAAGFRDA